MGKAIYFDSTDDAMLGRQRKKPLSPRAWIINGGGGFEDGEDGLRAATFSGEGLIDMLEAYREYLNEFNN